MNFPFYIARRYLFSKKKHNAINIISGISVCGVALATLALVCTPVGREKDGVHLCGRVSPCRVRNGELGRKDAVRRGKAEQRGCLRLWLRRHAGHGGVPRGLHRADGFAQGAFPLGRKHGGVPYGVRDRCQVHHQLSDAYGHRSDETVSDRGLPRPAGASSRAKACQCRLVQVALPGGEDAFLQGKPGEEPLV